MHIFFGGRGGGVNNAQYDNIAIRTYGKHEGHLLSIGRYILIIILLMSVAQRYPCNFLDTLGREFDSGKRDFSN